MIVYFVVVVVTGNRIADLEMHLLVAKVKIFMIIIHQIFFACVIGQITSRDVATTGNIR